MFVWNFPSSSSWFEGIRILYREACLTNLLQVRGGEARKLGPYVIDNVDIAVRPVVIRIPGQV
jgi:hypothetical protein